MNTQQEERKTHIVVGNDRRLQCEYEYKIVNVRDGVYKEYFDDGTLKMLKHYQNGHAEGPCTEWSEGNRTCRIYKLTKDEMNGPFEEWYNGPCDHAPESGVCNKWHDGGQLKEMEFYLKGKRCGLSVSYYENGQIHEKCYYDEGKLTGKYESYYPNGQPMTKCEYSEDKQHGLCEEWYENGQKRLKAHYDQDVKYGLCEEWYENGNMKRKSDHRFSGLHGLVEEWYENGNKKSRKTYVFGRVEGLPEEWTENGELVDSNLLVHVVDGLFGLQQK